HVPFLEIWSESISIAFEKDDPIPGAPGVDVPIFGGGGGGMSPSLRSSTGLTSTSLVAPLSGSSERGRSAGGGGSTGGGGSNGGGSSGSNDHTGDGNGNNEGSNGGGSD